MHIIFCAGSNEKFARVAYGHGFKIGARLPCKTYLPIWFADQDWKKPNREAYMSAIATLKPHMATVIDWERDDQLNDVLDWSEEASQYVNNILIVPKVMGGIDQLPRMVGGKNVILALSVPTKYGGTQLPIWEFSGWPVHLLGGSPHMQMMYYHHLASISDVVSADGNMANLQAHSCRYWSLQKGDHGHWRQLSDTGDIGKDGANLRAFDLSCKNIMEYWRSQNTLYSDQ